MYFVIPAKMGMTESSNYTKEVIDYEEEAFWILVAVVLSISLFLAACGNGGSTLLLPVQHKWQPLAATLGDTPSFTDFTPAGETTLYTLVLLQVYSKEIAENPKMTAK